MAPAPAIEDAAEVLLPLGDRVEFGFHVTLTAEWDPVRWGPVRLGIDAPGLLRRDGTFHLQVREIAEGNPPVDRIMEEVEAQYGRLKDLGFTLTYLDEHMLVGDVPGLGDQLSRFAADRGLVCDRDLFHDRRLALIPGWNGPGEHPGTELADHLSETESGTFLLFGHPGTKDESMQILRTPGGKPGEVAIRRNRERRMFMDIEIVDYCQNVGIELVRYSNI
jgi:hypothetical protein